MGNEITKKYELPAEHIATAGLLGLWKIYPGVKLTKDMVKKDVSVWILNRDQLAQRQPIPITEKNIVEQIFQIMRKDVLTMKELQHNSIVKVIEIVEEGRKGIVFVTERVICSLADILSRFEHVPGRYTWHQLYLEPDATITEMEISRGLLNIANGLQYLHSVKKKLHLNISPESIVLTPSGQWKLCGFGFSVGMVNDDTRVPLPYFLNSPSKTIRIEPDLLYCGPEMSEGANHGAMEAIVRYGTPSSDVFSLGFLAYEMYRYNLQIAPQGRTFITLLQVHNNSLIEHATTIIQILEKLDYSAVPNGLRQVLMGMLQPNPIARITGLDIVNNPFFHSGDLTVFKIVDDLPLKDIGSQASALSSLPSQIGHFSPRILENTILPVLCSLGVANPLMWVYSLPVIGFISTKLTTTSFVRVATTPFITGLAVSDVTETIFAFIKHMDLLLEKFDNNFFSTYVIPLICNGIDKQGATALQVSTISTLIDDRVLQAIDQNRFISDIIPRVCREACKNNDSDVKLRGLYLLKTTANRFDRTFVTKSIFPSLKHIIEKSPGPVVITACVGVYNALVAAVTIDTICTDVLPVLLPVLVDRTITRDQFEMILNRILFFQQLILTARTTEMNLSEVVISRNDEPKGYFFKEDSDKAKGIAISVGLSSSMLTPTVLPTPPQIPSSLPPSIPPVPPSFPPSMPPSVPFSSPPPLPVVAPPVIPMTPPPLPPLPFNSPPPPPTIPISAPPSLPFSQPPPVPPPVPPPPPTFPLPESSANGNGSMSTIASFFTSTPTPLPPPAAPQDQYIPNLSYGSPAAPPIPITAAPPPVPPPQPDLDMDDFMSSFSKSATSTAPVSASVSQPTQNAAPKRASYSDKPNAKKTGIPPPKSSQGSRAPVSGMDDLFGNLTISQSSSPSNNSGGSGIGSGGSGGYNTNPPSLEEQFRKNQEEINRLQQMQQSSSSQPPMSQFPQQQFGNYPLSGPLSVPQSNTGMMFGGQPAASGSMNFGVPAPATAAVNNNMSYGNNQPQYSAPFGTPNPGPYGGGFNSSPMQPSLPSPQPTLFPQNNGQLPQQFSQQQQQQQGYGGYGGQPQYSNQTNYGYSSTPVSYSNPPYSGGGGAPNSVGGGYRPPQVPAGIPPPNNNSKTKSDPFDFLS